MRGMAITLLDAGLTLVVLLLWPIRSILMLFSHAPLSVWTGAPIINMVINAKAERLIGARTVTVVGHTYFTTNKFGFNLQALPYCNKWGPLLRYLACAVICLRADRVHVYVDSGILPQKIRRTFNRTELRLYRLLGIPVLAWTYGADVRTQSITRGLGFPNCCTDCTQVMRACVCSTELARANYEFVHRHSRAIFSMGDMIEYTPGSRNDLFFWPIDLDEDRGSKYKPAYPLRVAGAPLKVLHAPNHREFKGTRYIERAISELQSEGVSIELMLVERVANNIAIEMYKKADIVVDQVMVGYHGYFALEAMALGKPVMCFIRDRQRYLYKPDECPLIDVSVATLKASLRSWADADQRKLEMVGRASRRYIEKNYSLEAFAQRLKAAYQDLGVTV